MVVFIIIIVLTIIAFFVVREVKQIKKSEKVIREIQRKDEVRKKQQKKQDVKKYGKPSKVISSYTSDRFHPSVKVFQSSKTIELGSKKFNFKDIIGYSMEESAAQEMKTSTSSAIKRGAVGGVLFGGVGALAGAVTANKNVTKTNQFYTIYVRVNTNVAVCMIRTEHRYTAENICSALDSIMIYNKQAEEL